MWHNICQDCWYEANPDQYLPDKTHFEDCEVCGNPGLTVKVQGREEFNRVREAHALVITRAAIASKYGPAKPDQYGGGYPHTRRGQADGPWPYGANHDFDCPACCYSGSSYTASPRSDAYWQS